MGVNTFLLDRRTATLLIGGGRHTVGTLRRFFKLTELDEERRPELDAANAAARLRPSPAAALIMDITELPLADEPGKLMATHLVLGWDEGRGSVTDLGWDYLPQLGYAVRKRTSGEYVLYEERSGFLHPLDEARSHYLGLLNSNGCLIRRGQPRITSCRSVKRYISGWVEADCSFENGTGDNLLVATSDDRLPPADWFVGKRPMDVQRFAIATPGTQQRR